MSCLPSFDQKQKKLYLLLFLFLLVNIINIILQDKIEFKSVFVFYYYIKPMSKILNIIPFFINKKYFKVDRHNSELTQSLPKNNIKDYIILILVIIGTFLTNIIIMINDDKGMDILIYNKISLSILIFSLLSKYFSEFKFYSYRIISFIMFFIAASIIDIWIYKLNDKPNFKIAHIILIIIYTIFSSIFWIYQKYIIEHKYISFYIACSFFGSIDLIFYIIMEIIGIKLGIFMYFNNKPIIFSYFSFKGEEKIIVQLAKSIPFLILNSIIFLMYYLTIYNFTVIHLVLIEILFYTLSLIYKLFQFLSLFDFLKMIALFIFLFISVFIYLEIIRLNCCGLNKNTRKYILRREKTDKIEMEKLINEDEDEEDYENNSIEISKGYLFKNNMNDIED